MVGLRTDAQAHSVHSPEALPLDHRTPDRQADAHRRDELPVLLPQPGTYPSCFREPR